MQNKKIGTLYALCGVFILSFDSLLVRLVDSSPWNLVFWRGLFLSATIITLKYFASSKHTYDAKRSLSIVDLIGGSSFAIATIFFVLAMNNTDATSTLAIFNTAPLFASFIAFIVLHEKLSTALLVAMMVSMLGIGIIFQHGLGVGQAKGDYYALIAAVGSASYLVALRKNRGVNGLRMLVIGGLVMSAVAMMNGAVPGSLGALQFIYMALLGCVVVPLSGFLISKSSNYLPVGQTSLVLLLELLLGPLWLFLVLNERPVKENLIGGSIVLITLIAHRRWERRIENTRSNNALPIIK
ncbi:DMT family transporter [Vibrio parahaemolyticus]|nr:DMT family transporter [Vibrio parahaemolyticus]